MYRQLKIRWRRLPAWMRGLLLILFPGIPLLMLSESFPVIETIINIACAIGVFALFAVGVVTLSLSIYTAIRKHNYRQLLVTLILGGAALYYLFDRLHLSSLIRKVTEMF